MGDGLTIERLARYTGEPAERLRDWEGRGLLNPARDGMFSPDEVDRVRLVQLLLRRGIDLAGVEVRPGRSLRWTGRYHEDMNVRDTLDLVDQLANRRADY